MKRFIRYWPLIWRSTSEAVEAETSLQIAELTAKLTSAVKDRDLAVRLCGEARRDESEAHAQRQKSDAALEMNLRRHNEDLRAAAQRQTELEEKYMHAIAELEEARQECQRWAEATRNGAGDPDLVVPRRPTRKPTAQDTKKAKTSRRKKSDGKSK